MSEVIIGVLGADGRMGQALIATISNNENCSSISASKDDELDQFFSHADIAIDFTAPEALNAHLTHAIATKTPLVIGTTGLSDAQFEAIKQASKHIAIVQAANMSVGVSVLMGAVKSAAKTLGDDFKIEITDKHHVHKKDAPSGTALAFEKAIHDGREDDKNIEYFITREGEIAGEHRISFKNDSEEVSFTHKAYDRKIFAKGAVRAALWLRRKPAGLYSIEDVLGL